MHVAGGIAFGLLAAAALIGGGMAGFCTNRLAGSASPCGQSRHMQVQLRMQFDDGIDIDISGEK